MSLASFPKLLQYASPPLVQILPRRKHGLRRIIEQAFELGIELLEPLLRPENRSPSSASAGRTTSGAGISRKRFRSVAAVHCDSGSNGRRS
jgi:hypothetical protein